MEKFDAETSFCRGDNRTAISFGKWDINQSIFLMEVNGRLEVCVKGMIGLLKVIGYIEE